MTMPELRHCEQPCGSIQSDEDGGGACTRDAGHYGHCSDGDATWFAPDCPIPDSPSEHLVASALSVLMCAGWNPLPPDNQRRLIEQRDVMRPVVEAAEKMYDTYDFTNKVADVRAAYGVICKVDAMRQANRG